MTESGPENIDDLMMGNVSEVASESDEKFKARVVAAQAKLAKIKKDETKSKDFDLKLSKLITALDPHTLRLVVFLINNSVPSLTILAMISLVMPKAEKICHTEFHKFIEEYADFAETNLKPELEKQVSLWWTYTLAANQIETEINLSKFAHDVAFREFVALECGEMLKRFLKSRDAGEHDLSLLTQALKKYEGLLFTESKS